MFTKESEVKWLNNHMINPTGIKVPEDRTLFDFIIEAYEKDHDVKKMSEYIKPYGSYQENVSHDAILGETWLKNGTSYIWKVGVLSVADGNKTDWIDVYIGIKRNEESHPYIIGRLSFPDGENTDCGRVMKRVFKMLAMSNNVFEDLENE
jgi:hypothetical protein